MTAGFPKDHIFGLRIDDLLASFEAGSAQHYIANDLSTIVKRVSSGGNLLEEYAYADYGEKPPSANSRFGFQGRVQLANPDLIDFRNRTLSASIGRFLTRDPIGVWGDAVNLGSSLQFTGGNPSSRVDPLGLWSGADAFLVNYYGLRANPLTRFSTPGHTDVSLWSGDYRADSSAQKVVDEVNKKIASLANSKKGCDGKCEKLYINGTNSVYITTIFSFGGGYLKHFGECNLCRKKCDSCPKKPGASITCNLTYFTFDDFKDPVDLHQGLGLPLAVADVPWAPFTFSLSWNESQSYTTSDE